MAVVSSCQVGNGGQTAPNRCVFRGWTNAKAIIASLWFCHSAFGATLVWDPNSEMNLAGYKVYAGTASRQCSSVVNVGRMSASQL